VIISNVFLTPSIFITSVYSYAFSRPRLREYNRNKHSISILMIDTQTKIHVTAWTNTKITLLLTFIYSFRVSVNYMKVSSYHEENRRLRNQQHFCWD
jgi:hypothetical protein